VWTDTLELGRHGLEESGLHHFRVPAPGDSSEAASLHNLALLYANRKLPITSVSYCHCKKSCSLKVGPSLSLENCRTDTEFTVRTVLPRWR